MANFCITAIGYRIGTAFLLLRRKRHITNPHEYDPNEHKGAADVVIPPELHLEEELR
jgi:hypothetical protein